MVIIFPLLTFITWNFHQGCYRTLPLGETPSSVFKETYKKQEYFKKNMLPMEIYNLAHCSIYNDQPAEKKTNMET